MCGNRYIREDTYLLQENKLVVLTDLGFHKLLLRIKRERIEK